ncbi:hypothetical protein BH20VER1_BH20VER1_00340 [soil metagenome]
MVREVMTLTTAQQRIIIFILFALVLFTLVKQSRQTRYPPLAPESQPSPSPGILP